MIQTAGSSLPVLHAAEHGPVAGDPRQLERRWRSCYKLIGESFKVSCLSAEHELAVLELDDIDAPVWEQIGDCQLERGGLLIPWHAVEDDLHEAAAGRMWGRSAHGRRRFGRAGGGRRRDRG